MPTLYEIPNVGVYEFPDDMSEEDIYAEINDTIVPNADVDNPDPEQVKAAPHLFPHINRGSIMGGLEGGLERAGRIDEAVGAGVGRSQESLDSLNTQLDTDAHERRYTATWGDVKDMWERGDYTGAVGTFVTDVAANTLGESLVPMAASGAGAYAGAKVGALAGTAGGVFAPVTVPLGTAAGAIIGGTLAGIPSFFGMNVERQVQENNITDPEQIETMKAASAAMFQSAAEMLVFRAINVLPGFNPTSAATREAIREGAAKLSNKHLAGEVLRTARNGMATEALTEVGQQMLERAQAGLEVTNPQALEEYIEAAVLGGFLGMGFGVGGGALSHRRNAKTVKSIHDQVKNHEFMYDQMLKQRVRDRFNEVAETGVDSEGNVGPAVTDPARLLEYQPLHLTPVEGTDGAETTQATEKLVNMPETDFNDMQTQKSVDDAVDAVLNPDRAKQKRQKKKQTEQTYAQRSRLQQAALAKEAVEATRYEAEDLIERAPTIARTLVEQADASAAGQGTQDALIIAEGTTETALDLAWEDQARQSPKAWTAQELEDAHADGKLPGDRKVITAELEALRTGRQPLAEEVEAATPQAVRDSAAALNIKSEGVNFDALVKYLTGAKNIEAASPFKRLFMLDVLRGMEPVPVDQFDTTGGAIDLMDVEPPAFSHQEFQEVMQEVLNTEKPRFNMSGLNKSPKFGHLGTTKLAAIKAEMQRIGLLDEEGKGVQTMIAPEALLERDQSEPHKVGANTRFTTTYEVEPQAPPVDHNGQPVLDKYGNPVPGDFKVTAYEDRGIDPKDVQRERAKPARPISRHATEAEALAAAEQYRGARRGTTDIDLRKMKPDEEVVQGHRQRLNDIAQAEALDTPLVKKIMAALKDKKIFKALQKQGVRADIVQAISAGFGQLGEGRHTGGADVQLAMGIAVDIYEDSVVALTDEAALDEAVQQLARVLSHEGIHALRALGVISKEDFQALARYATKKARPVALQKVAETREGMTYYEEAEELYRARSEADADTQGLTGKAREDFIQDYIEEEAVAEAFRDWANDKSLITGRPASLFRRIVNFFKGLGGFLNDQGATRAEDIFKLIEEGELGTPTREGGREGSGKFSVAPPVDSVDFKLWFVDSTVRDENYQPRSMYHGTTVAGGFRDFEDRTESPNRSSAKLAGHYFTPYKEEADWYGRDGGATLEVYLNLTNPLMRQSGDIAPQSLIDAARQPLADTFRGGFENEQEWVESKLRGHDGPLTVGQFMSVMENAGVDGLLQQKMLQEVGYDGMRDGSEHVVFSNDQVKIVPKEGEKFSLIDPNARSMADVEADTPRRWKIEYQVPGKPNKTTYVMARNEHEARIKGENSDAVRRSTGYGASREGTPEFVSVVEDDPSARYSVSGIQMYSRVAKAIEDFKEPDGTGKMWRQRLFRGDLPKAEIESIVGLEEMLANVPGRISKYEMLQFIDQKGLKLDEVVLMEGSLPGEPKFTPYTMDGEKTKQREFYITLPSDMTAANAKIEDWLVDSAHRIGYDTADNRLVVRIRVNERMVDGKRTLFIEEIQGDRQQEAKKIGWQGAIQLTPDEKEYSRLNELSIAEIDDKQHARWKQLKGLLGEEGLERVRYHTWEDARIPPIPWAEDKEWGGLALRRMIVQAVEEGYDSVAWTPGEVQIDRYPGTEKTINRLVYMKTSAGDYFVKGFNDSTNETIYDPDRVSLDDIKKRLGDEIAQRIVAGEGEHLGENQYTLPNLDLKKGGEAIRRFYDKTLVNLANKLGKRFKAKVNVKLVPTGRRDGGIWEVIPERDTFEVRERGYLIQKFPTREEADAYVVGREIEAEGKATQGIWNLDIPQAMSETVKAEGLPRMSIRGWASELGQYEYKEATRFIPLSKGGIHRGTVYLDGDAHALVLMNGHNSPEGKGFGLQHMKAKAHRFKGARNMAIVLDAMIPQMEQQAQGVNVMRYYPPKGVPSMRDYRIYWKAPNGETYILGVEKYKSGGTTYAAIVTFFPESQMTEEEKADKFDKERVAAFLGKGKEGKFSVAPKPSQVNMRVNQMAFENDARTLANREGITLQEAIQRMEAGEAGPRTTEKFFSPKLSIADSQALLLNNPEELGLTPELARYVSPIYQPDMLPATQMPSNKEAARWLEQRFPGVSIDDMQAQLTPEQMEHVSMIMAAEVQLGLQNSGNAFDWYSGALDRAIDIVKVKFPMVADDAAAAQAGFGTSSNARFVFTYIMAVTSQNLDVEANAKATDKAFSAMVKRVAAGRFNMLASWGTGDKREAMGKNFDKFGPLIKAMEGSTFAEKLTNLDTIFRRSQTVSEWVADMKEQGIPYSKPGNTVMSATVYGSSLLGPKIGNGFWQNLNGNFSPLTIDLWMRRTWGRLTGKSIGNPLALPAQRERLKNAIIRSRSRAQGKEDHIEAADHNVDVLDRYLRELRAMPESDFATKKEFNDEEKYLKARLIDAKEIAADLRGLKAPAPWKPLYNRDQDALLAYAKEALAVWNAEYKVLAAHYKLPENSNSGKVPPELQPTWARAAKTIITNLAKPLDQVANGGQRIQIENAGKRALEILASRGIQMTMADMQAVLWYPEKELWGALTKELAVDEDGIPVVPPNPLNASYDTVFERILGSQGYEVQGTTGNRSGGTGAGTVARQDGRSQQSESIERAGTIGDEVAQGGAGERYSVVPQHADLSAHQLLGGYVIAPTSNQDNAGGVTREELAARLASDPDIQKASNDALDETTDLDVIPLFRLITVRAGQELQDEGLVSTSLTPKALFKNTRFFTDGKYSPEDVYLLTRYDVPRSNIIAYLPGLAKGLKPRDNKKIKAKGFGQEELEGFKKVDNPIKRVKELLTEQQETLADVTGLPRRDLETVPGEAFNPLGMESQFLIPDEGFRYRPEAIASGAISNVEDYKAARSSNETAISPFGFEGSRADFDAAENEVIQQQMTSAQGFVEGAVPQGNVRYSVVGANRAQFRQEFIDDLQEKHKGIWGRLNKIRKRQLSPGGLLPAIAYELKQLRDGHITTGEDRIARSGSAMRRATKGFTEGALAHVNDMLNGKTIPATTPVNVVEAIAVMRDDIDNLSGEYITILQEEAARLKSEARNHAAVAQQLRQQGDNQSAARAQGAAAQAEGLAAKAKFLEDIIEGNKGEYMTRSYQVHDDPNWFKKIDDSVIQAAGAYIMAQNGGDMEAAMQLIRTLVKGDKTAHMGMESLIKEGKLGAKDLSILMKRKKIAPEIRALMGEYTDPIVNYTRTMIKMTRLIHNTHFLNKLKEVGMGTFLFEEGTQPTEGDWVPLAGINSTVMEPLGGLLVEPDVRQAFQDILGKNSLPDWMRTIVGLNGAIKFGKVVISSATQVRNFVSAPFFVMLGGSFHAKHLGTAAKTVWADMMERDGNLGERMRRYKTLRLVYESPHIGLLQDLLEDGQGTFNALNDIVEQLPGGKVVTKVAKTFVNWAKKFYRAADDFWKIVAFESQLDDWVEATGDNRADAEETVAERVRDTIPTYSMTGVGMKNLGRFPLVGSFVAFSSEVVRTNINTYGYMKSDMNDPRLAKLGRRRAIGMILAHSWAAGLSAASMAMVGIDDDEEEAIRKLGSPWARNSDLLIWGRNDKGQIETIDLSFLDPYNMLHKPIKALFRNQPVGDKLTQAVGELIGPFFGVDIAAGAIYEVIANRKIRGGPIYNADAPVTKQAGDIGEHLLLALGPGVFQNIRKVAKAMDGDVNSAGKPYVMADELLGAVGLRFSTFDPKFSLYFRANDYRESVANSRKYLSQVSGDLNEVSDSDLTDAFNTANDIRLQAFDEMRTLVNAARRSGVSDGDLRRVLRASGINKRDANAFARNRDAPKWRIGRSFMKGNIKRAKILLDRETAMEMRDRRNTIRQQARSIQ